MYPPARGRLPTRYSPVRRSPATPKDAAAARLACVRPAASVHPEPGSNPPWYIILFPAPAFSLTLHLFNIS